MEIRERDKGVFIIILTVDEELQLKEFCPPHKPNRAEMLKELLEIALSYKPPKREIILVGVKLNPERN